MKNVKIWNKGIDFDNETINQIHNISQMKFIYPHVAVMPDAHLGKGATVGTVIGTNKAIIPAAVGVDIGCGMQALKTNLKLEDMPESLKELRLDIESQIPCGIPEKTNKYKGSFKKESVADVVNINWCKFFLDDLTSKSSISDKLLNYNTQLGTLGSGNHFIEICHDEQNSIWLILHSGSRGFGHTIGKYFIEKAKELMEKYKIDLYLPDSDLSYLPENTLIFNDYIFHVNLAQEYAKYNRNLMMNSLINILKIHVSKFDLNLCSHATDCHHNYVVKENHYNKNVWVTRKGAVRARKNDIAIIPGSMGTNTYIVEGKGNKESLCSCSHGAGRKLSRKQAKNLITLEEHKQKMKGIESRIDNSILDESPNAYKDINKVIDAQKDLINIKYKLTPILNVKG